jgi:hypothetical protein
MLRSAAAARKFPFFLSLGGSGSKISIFFVSRRRRLRNSQASAVAIEKFFNFVLLSAAVAGKIQLFSSSRRQRLKLFDGSFKSFLSF